MSSQYPDKPELITSNMLKLVDLTPDEYVPIMSHDHTLYSRRPFRRHKFLVKNLVTHLHQFVNETRYGNSVGFP